MRALIIDDDPFCCEILRRLLAKFRSVEVVAEAVTMADAVAALERTDYNLVFLDIQLVGGSGFDLLPMVRPGARVVFVTGNDRFAVRAFELNALDYIIKPVTLKRLETTLARVSRHSDAVSRFAPDDRIFLNGSSGGRFAQLNDIVAVLSSENYSEVRLENGERWFMRRPLRAWEQILPPEAFFRAHRTAIVNFDAIQSFDLKAPNGAFLTIRGLTQPIPVSRKVWPSLRARLAARSAVPAVARSSQPGGARAERSKLP